MFPTRRVRERLLVEVCQVMLHGGCQEDYLDLQWMLEHNMIW